MSASISPSYYILVVSLSYFGVGLYGLLGKTPYYRPWEKVAHSDGSGFKQNQKITMLAYGDLAFESGIMSLRVPRKIAFTTDKWGFRNEVSNILPDVVVIGDSFVAGAGLDDSETLTSQLNKLLGPGVVYNRAIGARNSPRAYLLDERFKQHPPKLLVYCPSQRNLDMQALDLGVSVETSKLRVQQWSTWKGLLSQAHSQLNDWRGRLNYKNAYIWFSKSSYGNITYHLVGSDWVGYIKNDVKLRLSIQAQRLDEKITNYQISKNTRIIKLLERSLLSTNTKLIYCPIPDVGNIYPELYSSAEQSRILEPQYIELMLERAKEVGIDTVDLLRKISFESLSIFVSGG